MASYTTPWDTINPSEPWAATIARNILKQAILNAHELGVELTFEGQDS